MSVPVVYQQYNLYICIELQVSWPGFHLKHTFNGMLRFCQKMLQYYQYSKTLINGGKHFQGAGQ